MYSFEHNSDYVYDVQWSPTNPAVFACADGTGRLDLWNLLNDTEVPSASIVIDGQPALNKIRWNPAGHQIAIGDDQGRINLLDLNEAYVNVRGPDDWKKLFKVFKDFKENSSQSEEAGGPGNAGLVGPGGVGSNSLLGVSSAGSLSSSPASYLQTGSLPNVRSEPSFDHKSMNNFTSPISVNQSGQPRLSPQQLLK